MTSKKLHEQGVALFRQEKYEAALEKLNEALSAAADDPKQAAEIYNDLGVTYKQLEDVAAAHQALDEAWARFTELADQKGQAQTLGNRAAVYEAEGLLDEAVDAYKKSAAMLEEMGETEMAMYVWQAVSRLRMKQKQYVAAIAAYEEGVENLPKGSLKKKILQQILKMPGNLLGGPGRSSEPEQDGE
ncbi:MAG: tetratricopeptide repeat protein [Anaerolineae bacterium]|nr:tetratricopeptide repeat protein [Anaerolineae bacterium]